MPSFTSLADARWLLFVNVVEAVSLTVTVTPVAVFKVKPEADLDWTMPVAPPSAGPLRWPPSVGRADGVTDGSADGVEASEVPTVAKPAKAQVSTAPAIRKVFLFFNCSPPFRCVRLAVVLASPSPDGPAGSIAFMRWLLGRFDTSGIIPVENVRGIEITYESSMFRKYPM
ncbi:hypothetical protein ACWDFR_01215 [Streptomyces sp. 900105755]